MEQLLTLAKQAGFTQAAPLEASALTVRTEVREMCASDRCRAYGCSWSCPPACGTLEQCQTRMNRYHRGILLQTTGLLEDDFDAEIIKKWLKSFYRRFFTQQFKRNCMPDGPKVGPVGLAPRGDWNMPSDASARIWQEEAENL